MKIQLLYFDSCPGWQQTQRHLEEVLKELALNVDFRTIDVTAASQLPEIFYGSPTIRYKRQGSEEWQELFDVAGKSVMACRGPTFMRIKSLPMSPKRC